MRDRPDHAVPVHETTGPVQRIMLFPGVQAWMITGYAEVRELLVHPALVEVEDGPHMLSALIAVHEGGDPARRSPRWRAGSSWGPCSRASPDCGSPNPPPQPALLMNGLVELPVVFD